MIPDKGDLQFKIFRVYLVPNSNLLAIFLWLATLCLKLIIAVAGLAPDKRPVP